MIPTVRTGESINFAGAYFRRWWTNYLQFPWWSWIGIAVLQIALLLLPWVSVNQENLLYHGYLHHAVAVTGGMLLVLYLVRIVCILYHPPRWLRVALLWSIATVWASLWF